MHTFMNDWQLTTKTIKVIEELLLMFHNFTIWKDISLADCSMEYYDINTAYYLQLKFFGQLKYFAKSQKVDEILITTM